MADVFISYSRKDNLDGFVAKLFERLENNNIDAWMDKEDIPPAFDFLKEIYPAIESAHYFLFVVTPHSIASDYCQRELEQATKLNKLLIPVIRHDTDIQSIPTALNHLNWIWCRDTDDFEKAIQTLIAAIRTADQDYVHFHTRLLTRAREWDSNGRNPGFVLRGRSLQEAEAWLIKSGNKEPRITLLQSQYIAAGRQATIAFQRVRLGAVTIGFVVALVLALAALLAEQQAVNNASTAVANANLATIAQGQALNNAATATVARGQAQNNAATAVANANLATIAQGQALNNASTATVARGQAQNNAATAVANANLATVAQGQALNNASTATFLQGQAELEAARQANIALSRQLAAQALYRRPEKFDVPQMQIPLLLSLEANRFADTTEAHQSLLETLKLFPDFSVKLVTQRQGITSLAFSPDGTLLALGTNSGFIQIWDIQTRTPMGTPYKAYRTSIKGLAFNLGNQFLISAAEGDSQIYMWDVSTWVSQHRKFEFFGKEPIHDAGAFSPDGTIAVFPLLGGGLIVWDFSLPDPETIGEFDRDSSTYTFMVFSPDGQFLAAATKDNDIELWSFQSSEDSLQPDIKMHSIIHVAEPIISLVFSSDSKQLISSDAGDTITFWDWTTGKPIGQPLKGYSVTATSIVFGGNILVSANADGRVILWDPVTHLPLDQFLTSDRGVFSLNFTSQPTFMGDQTLAVGSPDGTLTLWNLDMNYWKEFACRHATRNLTQDEWLQYFGAEPYHETCILTLTATSTLTK